MMKDRRFWPLFWTQAFGAFNDNLFKNAIVILITYKSATLFGLTSEKLVALCGGIFILPFFLFSAVAGELADQRSKSTLSRFTKAWEIFVMLVGATGFALDSLPLLLGALFMLGVQATFFGPIKYGIIPELLGSRELVAGNALIELGTFVSILLGTLLGGVLMGLGETGRHWVSGTALAVALFGYLTSRKILPQPAQAPDLAISKRPIAPTLELIRIAKKTPSVFLSILAVSWFWLLGSVVLSVLPSLCKDALGGSESVLTFFLALFSIGVGIGSLLCERLSFGSLELGLVPIGSLGMSLFALDIGWLSMPHIATIPQIFSDPQACRLAFDMLFFSISAGLFTVPLYTLIQLRSDPQERSRIIAANNVLNALFMVGGALALIGLYAAGLKAPQIFLVLAGANAFVAVYVYTVLPEFFFRFVAWILTRILYRVKVRGEENFPESGAAIVVCNHVSFIDWLFISSACPRPIRFVMHYSFMKMKSRCLILCFAQPVRSRLHLPKKIRRCLKIPSEKSRKNSGQARSSVFFPRVKLPAMVLWFTSGAASNGSSPKIRCRLFRSPSRGCGEVFSVAGTGERCRSPFADSGRAFRSRSRPRFGRRKRPPNTSNPSWRICSA